MSTPPDSTPGTRKNARARDLFLAAFERTGMVSTAAKEAGVPRRTVYNWREEFEEFACAWDEAVERSTERMEREADRRAVDGWCERGIFDSEGERVGEVRKFSDTLLIFMLKARRPDVYRDHHTVKHEGTGKDGALPVAVSVDVSKAAHEFLAAIRDARA